MLDIKSRFASQLKYLNDHTTLNGHTFGELELVDRQLFFIAANRRDT